MTIIVAHDLACFSAHHIVHYGTYRYECKSPGISAQHSVRWVHSSRSSSRVLTDCSCAQILVMQLVERRLWAVSRLLLNCDGLASCAQTHIYQLGSRLEPTLTVKLRFCRQFDCLIQPAVMRLHVPSILCFMFFTYLGLRCNTRFHTVRYLCWEEKTQNRRYLMPILIKTPSRLVALCGIWQLGSFIQVKYNMNRIVIQIQCGTCLGYLSPSNHLKHHKIPLLAHTVSSCGAIIGPHKFRTKNSHESTIPLSGFLWCYKMST